MRDVLIYAILFFLVCMIVGHMSFTVALQLAANITVSAIVTTVVMSGLKRVLG